MSDMTRDEMVAANKTDIAYWRGEHVPPEVRGTARGMQDRVDYLLKVNADLRAERDLAIAVEKKKPVEMYRSTMKAGPVIVKGGDSKSPGEDFLELEKKRFGGRSDLARLKEEDLASHPLSVELEPGSFLYAIYMMVEKGAEIREAGDSAWLHTFSYPVIYTFSAEAMKEPWEWQIPGGVSG